MKKKMVVGGALIPLPENLKPWICFMSSFFNHKRHVKPLKYSDFMDPLSCGHQSNFQSYCCSFMIIYSNLRVLSSILLFFFGGVELMNYNFLRDT